MYIASLLPPSSSFLTHFLDLLHPLCSIVQSNQVPASYIEPIQIINRLLCIKDILIHNESRALLISSLPLPDLPYRPEPPKHIVHLLAGDLIRQVPHEDDLVDLRGQPHRFPFCSRAHSLIKIYYPYQSIKIEWLFQRDTFLSLSWFFSKNSWFSSYLMFTLSLGFFFRHLSKKSRASRLTKTYDGMAISSFTILMSSSSLVILNGFSPTSISYIMIPNDQISIFSSYYFPLRISGQTYSGVPQKVVLSLLSW